MNDRRFFFVALGCWTLFGLVTGLSVWISMLDHGHSVPWLLTYHLVVWLAWLGPTYVVAWLVRRFPDRLARPAVIALHLAAATAIAVLHAFYQVAVMLWMRPYDWRTAHWSDVSVVQVLYSRVPLGWILYAQVLVCVLAFDYYRRYHERALRAAQLERSLVDARLHALEAQLRPHFLFNTLNAVTVLVRSRRHDEAVTTVAGLAELLRYSLDHAGSQRVPLAQEMAMIERYLEIERVRFPDRLSYRVEMTADSARALVPSLILQPLAENAVRHGIGPLAGPGTVHVRAERAGARLHLRIANSGALAPAAHAGIGLRNTRERLGALYGAAACFALTSTPEGVLAQLELPWETAP